MQYLIYSAIGLAAFSEIIVLFIAFLGKKPFKLLFLNSLLGIGALAVVNIIGIFCDVGIPINEWTVGSGALFGLPSVIGLLLLNLIII